jgi:hypothetical protein
MKYLEVITEPHKILQTAKSPLVVTCNDFNQYVCKHNFGISKSLFNEYIASSFLKLWNIPTPDFTFINLPEDVINEFAIVRNLQPAWFKKTCFGSSHLQFAKEIDDNIENIHKNHLKKIRKIDLLKIALFDIWIANEDRTARHTNLLLNSEQRGNRLQAERLEKAQAC